MTHAGVSTAVHAPRYSHAQLVAKLDEFEEHLVDEALTSSARFTYVDQARRFVRWLNGEYRPRNAAARLTDAAARTSWDTAELRADLDRYRRELEAARLQPLAVRTYTERSETFIRWLDGAYTSRGPNAARTTIDEDDSWLDEAAVQERIVAWLEREGWTIVRQAHGRERGTDVDAERGDEKLSIEVKGHPRRIHSFGANKGEPRKWHPGAQARTYFGNALHAALTMLHADPQRQVAIALPDMNIYRTQLERSRTPLQTLGIRVLFVSKDGRVSDG